MTPYEIFLFVSIMAMQAVLCLLVYARQLYRRLPLFALYSATMLVSSMALGIIFGRFGFQTDISYYATWVVIAVTILVRSLAVAELCHESLRVYRGIWALTWRLLCVVALVFFIHAAIDARGQPDWFATYSITAERDVDIASAFIVVAMLLIGVYYQLPVSPLHTAVGLGICVFCVIDFANYSILRDVLAKYAYSFQVWRAHINQVNVAWNTVRTLAGDLAIAIWCFALRKPLPEPAEAPVLLPAGVYQQMSPAINLRLRAFNDRLAELLKP